MRGRSVPINSRLRDAGAAKSLSCYGMFVASVAYGTQETFRHEPAMSAGTLRARPAITSQPATASDPRTMRFGWQAGNRHASPRKPRMTRNSWTGL